MDINFLQQICDSATPRDYLNKLAELRHSIEQTAALTGDTSVASTKDYRDDYHSGLKRGDRSSLASSTNSDNSVGELSLDRLRAAADAATSAADESGSPVSTSSVHRVAVDPTPITCCCAQDDCTKLHDTRRDLDAILDNVEFGRQIFAEMLDTFTRLQGMKEEADEAKAAAEERLAEAKSRIQDLEARADRNRYGSPPPPSAWPAVASPGPDGELPPPELARTRRTSSSHQLPRRPGRPSTGRTVSTTAPFGTNTPGSSSNDLTGAAGSGSAASGADAAAVHISRSTTPSVPNPDGSQLPTAASFRVLELEEAIQARDSTIEDLNMRLMSQGEEYQRRIDEQENIITSLQSACDKAQTDARKADDYWAMFEEQASLREEQEKQVKGLQDEKSGLLVDIERLEGDVETWETRANELERKEREINGQATALKGLLEKKKDEVAELQKENKALNQEKDQLTRTVSALEIEDDIANKLRAQIQDGAVKYANLQTELRAAKSRCNELEGDLAQLRLEIDAKEGELAEAHQLDQLDGATGTVNSDRFASYSKSVHSQLAAAKRDEEEARQQQRDQQRPQSPGDENLSQDTDTDQSYEEIVTTVVKKRVPRRKSRTASSPLLELFEPAREDGAESDEESVTTQLARSPHLRQSSSSGANTDPAPRSEDSESNSTVSQEEESEKVASSLHRLNSQHAKVTRAWLQSVARMVPSGTALSGLLQERNPSTPHQPVLMAASASLLLGVYIGSIVFGSGDDSSAYGDAVLLGLYHHQYAALPETTSARLWRLVFGTTKVMRRSTGY
ncbi:hypothetical protein OC845_004028 [Tilletia horrida]|nr:hypothetical protein OC845_004028 [Tilletia horrida]